MYIASSRPTCSKTPVAQFSDSNFPQESISRTPDVQDGQAMLTSLDNNNKMASIKKENGSEDPIGEFKNCNWGGL